MGKVGVVIVAAGRGTRMKTQVSKQYLPLAGKPVLAHTLEAFGRTPEIDAVVLVVGPGEEDRGRELADRHGGGKVVAVVCGGEERQHSVYQGLTRLPADVEWVLVHDGVRPLVSRREIAAVLEAAREPGAAVVGVPVKDTIKLADRSGMVVSTPDRRSLWAIQTPQAFRLSVLLGAYEQALREGFVGTDDASLAERAGQPVRIVEGSYRNIKITTPEDLEWAEWVLRKSGEEQGG